MTLTEKATGKCQVSQSTLHYGNTICDGGRLIMTCPADFVLHVLTAEYGRTDLKTCPDAAANTTDCRGPDIADSLRPQCDDKSECHVMVGTHLQTTDTCPGTSKYLHVAYDCAPRVYQTLACQDKTLSLDCPDDGVIRVTEATFGRTTASVCPQEGAQATTNCSEPTALQTASRICNNEHKCDINATTPAFGEPCLGVHKYLNVSFKCGECVNKNAMCDHWASVGECSSGNAAWMEANCRKACWKCETDPTVHNITCEGKNAKLSCTNNMSLRIMGVFYGRKDNSICPHTAIHSNSCGDTTAPFQRAHKLCTGRSKCKVDVFSKTMGGDTCPNTYKYMELDYRCQACVNALGNDTRCEWLAKQGECLANPHYMYRDCFLTCSKCRIPACGNIHKSCEYFAMAGECVKTRDWMAINCIESCRWCPEVTATTTTVSPATTAAPGGNADILKNVSACEGFTMMITCPKGKAISIKSAFYGRHGNETCPHVKAPADADCFDTKALSKLRQLCNAYENCGVYILTSKLGDPCPGIYKYANVTYKCIARSEIQCEIDCGTHGACIGDNTCACHKGYNGEACNKFSCSEVNECSSHGTCSGPNKCRCDGGWLGDTCDVPSCSGVNHCSKHGQCIGVDKCFCYPFFSGATCSKCDTSFPAGGSKTCLPCPQCQHGTCVQKTEADAENSSYVGCFKDKQNDRDLEHLAWDSEPNLSTIKCVLKCYLIGYKFAGLQDGNRCYCGNDYGHHGETDTCNSKCSGTIEGDVCGGRLATSVWRVTAGYWCDKLD
ncbi:hypothetical protein NP493_734g00010 [Ridgeia piscesae]|uniref:Uncharacterized protein n=1 Tax=Ridgeia piscesae TaxID=27915 RepID=A0AAD9NM70_RIDPI|nr:hypothetical protein NP493_734g00010 [Ridgeia piscesae]